MKPRTIGLAASVMSVTGALTWVCVAGPALPVKPLVTEEVYSLGHLEKVKVEVKVLSKLAELAALDLQQIKREMTDQLVDGNINVVDEGNQVPTVSLVIMTNTDSRFDGITSVTYHISLEQVVLVRRLEREVVAPTYALVHGILALDKRLLFDLRVPIGQLVNHFLNRVAEANMVVDRQEIIDMAE